jgi:phosphopantothenoylcysteine decarboxylase
VTRSGLVATPNARVVDHGEDTYVLGPDGAKQLSDDSAALVRAILQFVAQPRTREEIVSYLEALSGGTIDKPEVIDDAIALLVTSGAVVENLEAAPQPGRGRLLLCVSGAVAAAGAPELAMRLQRAGFELRVALSRDARRFVSTLVLEAVTQQPVPSSLWQREVPHIALAEWAQLVLVCPASATTISRIAGGDCSDLVSAIVVGSRAPKLLVPSMNAALYGAPQVQRNLALLKDDGFWITHAGPGAELAHSPSERAPIGGAMPSHAAVVDLACFVASRR